MHIRYSEENKKRTGKQESIFSLRRDRSLLKLYHCDYLLHRLCMLAFQPSKDDMSLHEGCPYSFQKRDEQSCSEKEKKDV
jgi:hypothetical protein